MCVFVALGIQPQWACVTLSSVACPALQHFSKLSHKRHDLRKNVTEYKLCVSIFSTTFIWNISHSKKECARYDKKNVHRSLRKVAVYSCQILMKIEFSRQIFKKSSNLEFHENPSSGSRVVAWGRTDSQTDMTKHIVAFRNFSNPPKNHAQLWVHHNQ